MNDLVYKDSSVFVLSILLLTKFVIELFPLFYFRGVYKLLVVFSVLLGDIFDGFV